MSAEDLQLRVLGDTVRATEDTLRAYDLKAEIAMICFVLSIEAINVFISLGKLRDNRPVLCGFLFLLFIAAMVGYMTVLLPIYKRKAVNAASYTQKEKTPDSEAVPNRSTYNSGATGTQAFYTLLAETGRKVTRWQDAPAALSTASTLPETR